MAKAESKVIPITIIGIDSSTSCTGISVIRKTGKKEELLSYSKFSPEVGWAYEVKIEEIVNKIETVYLLHKDSEPIVAIELLNSPKNLNTTRKLAGLWACIKVKLHEMYGVRVASLNTISIKKLVTGDGKADKYKMVKYINKYFNIDLKYHKTNKDKSDDDIADSIGVALSVARLLQKGEKIEKYF